MRPRAMIIKAFHDSLMKLFSEPAASDSQLSCSTISLINGDCTLDRIMRNKIKLKAFLFV